MDKSYVTMEQKACAMCGNPYDTGSILLDRRLNKRFDRHTITGVGGLCPECKKKYEEQDYIALVVVANTDVQGNTLKQEDAVRTGEIIHIKKHVADKLFNVKITTPLVFINEEAAKKIKEKFHGTQSAPDSSKGKQRKGSTPKGRN